MTYEEIVEQRKKLKIDGYRTLETAGIRMPYVTPYQKIARSKTGPVLLGYNFIDYPTACDRRREIIGKGYLKDITFNAVLDRVLSTLKMCRGQFYVTQVFHLLPPQRRWHVSKAHAEISFNQITRYELEDREIIALGRLAADMCRRHGFDCEEARHPSAGGRGWTYERRADDIVKAFRRLKRQYSSDCLDAA